MLINRRHLLITAAATGLNAALPAKAATQNLSGAAFGSTWRVAMSERQAYGAVRRAITGIINAVDAQMSPWQADSEISRFNAAQSTDWITLSPQICTVLAECQAIATLTEGAFDPGVGPLVNRYGFGPIQGSAASLTDLELRPNAARKTSSHLTLDLCGIAKGYALDQMTVALNKLGLHDYLIELGGEIRSRGSHPDGRDWTVGIERPGPEFSFQRIIAPRSLALATSGTFQNGYHDGARQTNHLIDPKSGTPIVNDIASVSVLATTAMRADALATALAVMGLEDGFNLAEANNIKALFLTGTGPNFTETSTGSFNDHILA